MGVAADPTGTFWRVFPWDPGAADGEPFSARYTPPAGAQTGGRFDLGEPPVLYLAERPESALAELLQRFRGKPLRRGHLRRADRRAPGTFHPLSLVEAHLPAAVVARMPDLGDPAELVARGIRPDSLASSDRRITQPISRAIHADGAPGFRWWSALSGDWHVSVLFMDRVVPADVQYGEPNPLDVDHPLVRGTARLLRMPLP